MRQRGGSRPVQGWQPHQCPTQQDYQGGGPQWPVRPFPLTPLMSTPGCSSEVCSECLSCSEPSQRRPLTSSLGPRPQPHLLSGSGLPGTSRVSRRCIPVSLALGWAQRGSGEQGPESSCSHRTVLCMGARPGACMEPPEGLVSC